ncbi:alcohol dehydrogenase catalytic domain-containing protein [Propionimicrobium sp. PCR01-08-3]|uniref:zinc-dependent alcohol dehydrogenase n=1 Tax=Propionimicrobium sp. PCR01-08-3 TaxID=3052086 RepID=UPI00255CBCEF|nr:alcohol dehydrogenase catalytic domain-containing protein [Propionimicrobium sp. PCR01-08-3]WIY82073.1 alcohol dehydrogenase catalytic domain-containing protein [Propionimicrobium sp. PCR01-08-3]
MRALVITGAREAAVQDVPAPVAVPGEVVVDVKRSGICGTDIELFTGEQPYFDTGHTSFPVRIGHEWMGVVSAVGEGVDAAWLGARVTGDTMLGCGKCRLCRTGRGYVCESRTELGIRGGRPGALAEQVAVPETALHRLPDSVDDAMGAMVEPGGNAYRAVQVAALDPGDRCLVLGAGTIGLLCGLFARAAGAEVHLLGRSERSQDFARAIGFEHVWTRETLPDLGWDAVIEASNAQQLPATALDLVEPGKRVVYIGLAGTPSLIDTRNLVLADVTAVGVLSASPGLAGTIETYAAGAVDPRPLVAATLSLDELPMVLAGGRPQGSGAGPKFHVRI